MTTTYKIIEGNDKDSFASLISTYLSLGWSLHGPTTINTVVLGHNGVTTYFQALVAD